MANKNLLALTDVKGQILAALKLAAGDNTVYVVPANKGAEIKTASLLNRSAAQRTFSLALVPAGTTAAAAARIFSDLAVDAGDTLVLDELVGARLGEGDFVWASPSAADALDLTLTGLVLA